MFKSKLFVGLTLLIFFVVTTSILTAGLITKSKEDKLKTPSGGSGNTLGLSDKADTGNADTGETATVSLSEELVAKHNVSSDCWIVIDDFVYDVTSFLSSHPGGSEQIIPYCGRNASQAFATKDKDPSGKHSTLANNMLKDYAIGKLGDNINVSVPSNVKPTNPPVSLKTPINKVLPISFPTSAPQTPVVNSTTTLTVDEVAKHNTQIDCWMIIAGNVYNLSSYVSMHPGGLIIASSCGRDGTTAFSTQGGKGSHSSYANNLLGNYLLGLLNSVATNPQNPSGTSGTTPTNNPNPTSIPNQPPGSSGMIPASILSKYPDAVYVSGKYEYEGEWEGKINTSGTCRAIKVSSNGSIGEDKSC